MKRITTERVEAELRERGCSELGVVLPPDQCRQLRQLYTDDSLFRSRIDMARYRFGKGEYKYFAYPLPEVVADLRESLYAELAPLAVRWMEALQLPAAFPADHGCFVESCHQAGQTRPTPLLLHYREGDYNCLHQDLYGKVYFPFQVVVCLSTPGEEFTGGELLMVESRPRAQSVGHALTLGLGEAAVLTTRYRPHPSARGFTRTNCKHGVSPVRTGERFTLGIIFHDGE